MEKYWESEKIIQSFEPIIDKDSRVLMLGTMPGEESLRHQQYYAHPQNLFWPLIYQIFNKKPDPEYEMKVLFLRSRNIALWDVFESCEREGSLDSEIRREEPNNVAALLEEYPKIHYVFCNGEKAAKQFRDKVFPEVKRPIYFMRLPSTSPANASIPFCDKLNRWLQVRNTLQGRILHQSKLETDIGIFTIWSSSQEIVQICLPGSDMPSSLQYAVFSEDETGKRAKEQIMEYIQGRRRIFDIPLQISGTEFQKKIYCALSKIPYGSRVSYGELAEKAGNKNAARAVGQALRANPLPILVPCHRVVGSNGKSIGFMGIRDNPLQHTLLALEQNNISKGGNTC